MYSRACAPSSATLTFIPWASSTRARLPLRRASSSTTSTCVGRTSSDAPAFAASALVRKVEVLTPTHRVPGMNPTWRRPTHDMCHERERQRPRRTRRSGSAHYRTNLRSRPRTVKGAPRPTAPPRAQSLRSCRKRRGTSATRCPGRRCTRRPGRRHLPIAASRTRSLRRLHNDCADWTLRRFGLLRRSARARTAVSSSR
jgi:hypothetical protein